MVGGVPSLAPKNLCTQISDSKEEYRENPGKSVFLGHLRAQSPMLMD